MEATGAEKRYAAPEGAGAAFVAEASGLAFAGSGPRLLAAGPGFLMVVLEDLGSHPSLADRLLGGSAESAGGALREWASCYGRLAAVTVGREAELDRLAELGLSVLAGLDDEIAPAEAGSGPHLRQILRYRWQSLLDQLEAASSLCVTTSTIYDWSTRSV